MAATNNGAKLMSMVQKMEPQIKRALPSVITPERFTRIALSALANSPTLCECTPISFLGSLMNAAQLGLEPNTPLGQAYLIPYWNTKKGVRECQFQIGYKGLLDLAYRNQMVQTIQAHTVYEGDTFEYSLGLDEKLHHVPAMSGRGKAIAYYAFYRLQNGGYGFQVMSREDVEEHRRKYSQASKKGQTSPWDTSFDAMAKKTVIKQLLKYAPIKSDLQYALSTDEQVLSADKDIIDSVSSDISADNPFAQAQMEAQEQPQIEEQPRQTVSQVTQAKRPEPEPVRQPQERQPARQRREDPEEFDFFGGM